VLQCRTCEVERDLVTCNRGRGADREVALRSFEHVLGFETTIGESCDRRTDDSLRVVEELVHRRDDPVAAAAFAELGEAARGERVCCELGPKIAAALLRVAHLRDEVGEHVLVEARRRNDDALIGQRA
jgi:hypothetical protein